MGWISLGQWVHFNFQYPCILAFQTLKNRWFLREKIMHGVDDFRGVIVMQMSSIVTVKIYYHIVKLIRFYCYPSLLNCCFPTLYHILPTFLPIHMYRLNCYWLTRPILWAPPLSRPSFYGIQPIEDPNIPLFLQPKEFSFFSPYVLGQKFTYALSGVMVNWVQVNFCCLSAPIRRENTTLASLTHALWKVGLIFTAI